MCMVVKNCSFPCVCVCVYVCGIMYVENQIKVWIFSVQYNVLSFAISGSSI